MNEIDIILPPPQLAHLVPVTDMWTRNCDYFALHRAELLKEYRDKFVAVHEGKVVAHGDSIIEVAEAGYRACGYVPIYVDLVSENEPAVVRMPSPIRDLSRNT